MAESPTIRSLNILGVDTGILATRVLRARKTRKCPLWVGQTHPVLELRTHNMARKAIKEVFPCDGCLGFCSFLVAVPSIEGLAFHNNHLGVSTEKVSSTPTAKASSNGIDEFQSMAKSGDSLVGTPG
jgi:hypothetical protein